MSDTEADLIAAARDLARGPIAAGAAGHDREGTFSHENARAMRDLKLKSMVVFCPATKPYDLAPGIRVRSLNTVVEGMDIFR